MPLCEQDFRVEAALAGRVPLPDVPENLARARAGGSTDAVRHHDCRSGCAGGTGDSSPVCCLLRPARIRALGEEAGPHSACSRSCAACAAGYGCRGWSDAGSLKLTNVTTEVGKLIVGKEEVIEQLLIAIFARSHCLLEGVPGLAKTYMVKTLSDALQLSFRRVQFTPDLMPADITGTDIISEDPATGRRELTFLKGPLFAQMILADEINRSPPKTQAALLEAMQEHSVTVGGRTYKLDSPSSCSRRRTRSSRAPTRCPRRRKTASCSRPRGLPDP